MDEARPRLMLAVCLRLHKNCQGYEWTAHVQRSGSAKGCVSVVLLAL